MKAVLFVMDGLGDWPIPELNGRTPLEAADIPNMNRLSKEGINGMHYGLRPGIPVGSDTGHLAIFGYDPFETYSGRGAFEALGAGFELKKGDVAFRANFATVENGVIVDRRAGRSDYMMKELSASIDGIKIEDVEIIFKHTVEHRGVLILRGSGLSKNVSDTDPHGANVAPLKPVPTAPDGEKTARVLAKFLEQAHSVLSAHEGNKKRMEKGIKPANVVLLRGAGTLPHIKPLDELYHINAVCIAGGALYKGVAKAVGMRVLEVPGATGKYDTDLKSKGLYAVKELEQGTDFVFIHVKATDNAAHDKNPLKKKEMIEKVDRELIPQIMNTAELIVVTGDHTTSSITGEHTGDAIPLLMWGKGVRTDAVDRFGERTCARGNLGIINARDIVPLMLNPFAKVEKFGE
ncbi:MAG: 2,3-bisphosphoglycerate-independent phosphoglycerate mutase [Candidatus Korarchaeota archaeon]